MTTLSREQVEYAVREIHRSYITMRQQARRKILDHDADQRDLLRQRDEEIAGLKQDVEIGLQISGSFFSALKPVLTSVDVQNPGRHITDLITQLAATQQHLEAQQTSTYQAVEREHEAKQQLTASQQRVKELERINFDHELNRPILEARCAELEKALNECPRKTLLLAVDEVQKAFIKTHGNDTFGKTTMNKIVEAFIEFLREEADHQMLTLTERPPT
jgi:hypothetical protein